MVAVRRKVVDQADAEWLLDAWDDSGLELPAFCSAQGVDGRSLQCWAMNLGRREQDPRLASLGVVELGIGQRAPAPAAVYRLVVGRVAVEVGDAFRDDTLARLLRVVSRC